MIIIHYQNNSTYYCKELFNRICQCCSTCSYFLRGSRHQYGERWEFCTQIGYEITGGDFYILWKIMTSLSESRVTYIYASSQFAHASHQFAHKLGHFGQTSVHFARCTIESLFNILSHFADRSSHFAPCISTGSGWGGSGDWLRFEKFRMFFLKQASSNCTRQCHFCLTHF